LEVMADLVLPNCKLAEEWRQTDSALSQEQSEAAVQQVKERLAAIDPLLSHLLVANMVRNERRNFINLRFRRGRFKLLFRRRLPDQRGFACIFLCDNLQPWAEVCVIDPALGELSSWGDVPTDELQSTLAGFQHHYSHINSLALFTEPSPQAERFSDLASLRSSQAASPSSPFSLYIDLGWAELPRHIKLLQTISPDQLQQAGEIAMEWPLHRMRGRLRQLHPLLGHMVFTRDAIQVQPRFLATVYFQELGGDIYEFHLSEKIEPYIIVIVINPYAGKLTWLNRSQVACLEQSLAAFKQKYGIHNETYHYTSLRERQATDEFVRSGHAPRASKAHSSDFHLKMRVATAMVRHLLPALTLFDLDKARREVEPIAYNFGRENSTWAEVRAVLLSEVEGAVD